MSDDFQVNESASNAPEEVLKWAKRLTTRQGCRGVLSRETSGYHLYLPCPECLETHGRRELDDPKYSINLSMLAGLGDFRDTSRDAWSPGAYERESQMERKREFGSGICMRTRSSRSPHRFSIETLLNMATVTERFPDIHTSAGILGTTTTAENADMWEEDPVSGQPCPPPAGTIVPVTSLPASHPCYAYLTNRGYDPSVISQQFRLGFCTEEYPGSDKGIFYRKMPGGWRDTPQHRVVFHSLIDGVPLTWQARVIEKVSDDELNRYMLHPYAGGFFPTTDEDRAMSAAREGGYTGEWEITRDNERKGLWVHLWSHTHTRANAHAEWQPVSPFDEIRDGALRFKPSKYRTAKYSSRQLMGWDAALQRAEEDSDDIKWCVLCEGPLDAARIGPGGVAVIGSSLSPENAAKIASKFRVVFTAFDADRAGKDATEKISYVLQSAKVRAPMLDFVMPIPLPPGKDPGSLSTDEYQKLFQRSLKRSKR